MRILSDVHGLSVSLSLVTLMHCDKMAEPIEMPLGMWGEVRWATVTMNYMGVWIPHGKGQFWGEEGAVP